MTEQRQSDYRWLLVAGLYVAFAIGGCIEARSNNSLLWYLNTVLYASLATGWCVSDAWHHDRPLLPVIQMLMFLTWFAAVPIYLIWSRGWKGLGYALLNGVGIIATYNLFLICAFYLTYGAPAFSWVPE